MDRWSTNATYTLYIIIVFTIDEVVDSVIHEA